MRKDDEEMAALKGEACDVPVGNFVEVQPMHSANMRTYDQMGTIATPPVYIQTSAPIHATPALGERRTNSRQPPPPGRWSDSICDWTMNLYPSCYCACCVCCGIYLVAQMAEKVGYAKFRSILTAFVLTCIVGFIFQLVAGAALIVWIPLLFSFSTALILRIHIVHRQGIQECGSSPCFGEFCVGFWCWYCSVAQMARHVYGYNKVLDGDGDPERPDNYAPLQQV